MGMDKENNHVNNVHKKRGKMQEVQIVLPEIEPFLPENAQPQFMNDILLTDETSCGFWFMQGPCLQKFANKKAYVFLYGLLGCVCSAAYAYFNGTITTLEKRFKIPSRTTGK